jgi:hypothetical protein
MNRYLKLICALFLSVPSSSLIAEEEFPLCGAHVKGTSAAFLFPILNENKWKWYRPETADDGLEYSWEVLIPPENPQYSFGIYLFKFQGMTPKEGSLEELLKYTQKSVTQRSVGNGHSTYEAQEEFDVRFIVKNQGVVVGIVDENTFRAILGDRPTEALFHLRHPDPESSVLCRGKIQYVVEEGDLTKDPSGR